MNSNFEKFNFRTGVEKFVHLFDSLSQFSTKTSASEKSTLMKLGVEFCEKISGGQTSERLNWMFCHNEKGKELAQGLDVIDCRFFFFIFISLDDFDGMMTSFGDFCQTLSSRQKMLFRCAFFQYLPVDVLMKHGIVYTQGEYDYAKYDNSVKERLELGELSWWNSKKD
jgi:hypothetical protein